jgi:ubiquinone/menaquinone biosynthesis C-methylase UbiE
LGILAANPAAQVAWISAELGPARVRPGSATSLQPQSIQYAWVGCEEAVVRDGFQLEGQGPEAYERYLVPAFFAECAEQLLGLVPAGTGQRVLDVACGTGVVARLASAQVGAEGMVVAMDVNDGMIDVARAVAADATGAITWHTADAAALPAPAAAFDIVYCQQGLQFIADRPQALREMHRVLAPGGRVAIAIWRGLEHNPAFAAFVHALAQHAGEEAAAMMRAPFAGPDRDEIRRLMGQVGFDKMSIRIGVVLARFRSAAELLRHEVLSSPLAGPVGALSEDRYDALGRDLTKVLYPYVEDDGIAFAVQTWLATAHR